MDIRVADNKILDTSLNKDLLGQVITDVVLALLSYMAEGDWEERHELQRQGIETAKEAGKYLGRPRVEMSMDGKWYLVGLPGLQLDGLEGRQG